MTENEPTDSLRAPADPPLGSSLFSRGLEHNISSPLILIIGGFFCEKPPSIYAAGVPMCHMAGVARLAA